MKLIYKCDKCGARWTHGIIEKIHKSLCPGEKLNPCPSCNVPEIKYSYYDYYLMAPRHHFYCKNCSASTMFEDLTKIEAIAKWNST